MCSELLDVSQLRQIAFHKEAWHHLAIEEDYKEALETMVLSHVSKVAGLRGSAGGKGLSILLNGEAGVGKTLTAGTSLRVYSDTFILLTEVVRIYRGTFWKTFVHCHQ